MSKQLKFNFNPFKEGINQVLGTLEKEIMEALWNRDEGSVKRGAGRVTSRQRRLIFHRYHRHEQNGKEGTTHQKKGGEGIFV